MSTTSALLSAITEQSHRTPSAPAITSAGARWTYRALGQAIAERVLDYAPLADKRVVVAVKMVLEPDSVVSALAAAETGHTPLLLPPNLEPAEERVSLREAQAAYIASPETILPLGDDAWCEVELPPGLIQMTSGSMGPSRPAFRTWAGVEEEVASLIAALDLSRRDTVMVTSSLAHSYAFMAGILAPLSTGAHVVIAGDASTAVAAMPTIVLGLPATYRTWCAQRPQHGLERVRFAFSAGAPLPNDLFEDVHRILGLSIRQDYGTTETGTIAIDTTRVPDPNSVGDFLPHLQHHPEAPAERESEIEVRGRAVASGYMIRGRLVPCTDDAGWYRTGDLGNLAPDGRLRLTGRLRPPLRGAGGVIDPGVLEAAAMTVPGVREAVALQMPSEGAGIKVVVTGDVRQADLNRWARERGRESGDLITVQRRESLPRSPAGKLLRKYLM